MRIQSIPRIALAACAALVLLSCGGSLLASPPVEAETADATDTAIAADATETAVINVTDVAATASQTTAAVTWATDLAATHVVEYGTVSGSYTGATVQSATAETAHTVSLTSLAEKTTYYYVIKCYSDAAADVTSAERSFTTTDYTHPSSAEKLRGIWMVGGLNGSNISSVTTVSSVDLYDPVTDAWYEGVTTIPVPVSFAGAASWGGNIYVIGGFDASGNPRDSVQIYDVSANSWGTGASIPSSSLRANITATVANNRIYVLGGSTAAATGTYAASNTTYEYNPSADSWNAKVAFASSGAYANRLSLAFNDVIYNMGGRTAATTLVSTHDGVVLSSNSLTASLTEIAISIGGTASARCGMAGVMHAPSSGPSMMAIVGGALTLSGVSGNFIFNGATGATFPSATFQYLYYPFASPYTTWSSGTNYPLNVICASAGVYGTTLYVFGGATNAASPSGLVNVYTIGLSTPTGSWTAAASMPTGRYGHTAVAIAE